MTFSAFATRAATCTNMQQLEKLFIDKRMYIDEPDWRFVRVWNENKARIEGDGQTGEVLEGLPF